ncbi:MAG TPA: alpha-L-arabinofuranosidase C-terminal domain-containing protein [Verrucomicrobiae bacterium]|jgi:alpha-N-arabinofuranosidase
MKQLAIALVCTIAVAHCQADPTFTVDAGHTTGNVSPMFHGLMTEEINHSYDGGLYAELVQNRAFLDNATDPVHWSVVNDGASSAQIALDQSDPYNSALTTSLRLMVTGATKDHLAGVANDGYWGIPVTPHTRYAATIIARAGADFSGPLTVSIVSDDGKTVYAKGHVSRLPADWKKFEVTLHTGRVTPTTQAHLAITLDSPGTVWFAMVSLFPPTWHDQPNGFRKDLMQMLVDMDPQFLRFPGGNYVEGDSIPNHFDWKKTIGPIEDRHGHPSPWGYRSTDGMGLLEFLEWCEDMKAEPLLAVYAGYSLNHTHVDSGPGLEPYVQDALDEIQYVTGSTDTPWGAQRAKDGHPAPFPLHYVEIGNEDWFDHTGSYDARYAQFYDAIKAQYPQLKLISTIGNDQPDSAHVKSRKPDVTDEHYYRSVDTFVQTSPDYARNYDRSGPEIFVGEWASYETSFPPWDGRSKGLQPTPDFKAAIGDAVFMAAMERNADLIKMQCYAPMLVNVNPGARQWRPNLIGYDGLSVYGSPSYYAIQMFNRNLGDEILGTASQDTAVQGSATCDSKAGEIFLKLVNPQATAEVLNVQINGVKNLGHKAMAITLTGNPDDYNTIDNPKKIAPVTDTVRGIKSSFTYNMPPDSIVVLKLKGQCSPQLEQIMSTATAPAGDQSTPAAAPTPASSPATTTLPPVTGSSATNTASSGEGAELSDWDATNVVLRLKAGLTTPFIDSDSNVWQSAEEGFDGGDVVERDPGPVVTGTKDPAMFLSEHYGMDSFSWKLPNGKYIARLFFAETYDGISGTGQRVFSFNVQGHEYKDFDVWARAGGPNRAYTVTVPIEVTKGVFKIDFTSNIENPQINAIEIFR